jgi:hypothetical protein
MRNLNPFSGIRASEYSDDKINSLWVEFGPAAIDQVIEPHSQTSKFILGGKGSGKTHLLRYHSYQVARLRYPNKSGIGLIDEQKFLAVFLRAVGVDASRFDGPEDDKGRWQKLFGVYLELCLIEKVVEALLDIRRTSPDEIFDDLKFVSEMSKHITSDSVKAVSSVEEFLAWVIQTRKDIDDAVNNYAFTDHLDVKIPFNLTVAVLKISKAMSLWHSAFSNVALIYLIDEIENFSSTQQEVVNTFIRYGEGQATFRVTGRLYAVKTFSTLGSGEQNKGGAEFKIEYLDEKLRNYSGYPAFAKKFIAKHLYSVGAIRGSRSNAIASFDPKFCFEEIRTDNFYEAPLSELNFGDVEPVFVKIFRSTLEANKSASNMDVKPDFILQELVQGFPVLLQKLNILIFSKKLTTNKLASETLQNILAEAEEFLRGKSSKGNSYSRAYGHYAGDLFAQLYREAKNGGRAPYAGFDTFVKMSAGNPRNLLITLGRAYDIATYRQIDFINEGNFPIALQTQAVIEAADFAFEKDASFGVEPEIARLATGRLAAVLRTARYSLKIPEVSPLAVSFSDDDLTHNSNVTVALAKHYSFLFDIPGGRPDRNSERLNRKLQLNPMMAPKWGLPLGRRGDLKLSKSLLNSIFDPDHQKDFEKILRGLERKWNSAFKEVLSEDAQEDLF